MALLYVEAPIFPMKVMRITQGMNESYSHKGTMNLDLGGENKGADYGYAPSEIKIVQITTAYNSVIFESTKPVFWADGSYDYYHMEMMHDSDISDLKVGMVFAQDTKIYDEGGKGPRGPRQYAAHIHMAVGRGKYAGKVKNLYGVFELKNEVEPYKLFFVNGIEIKNGMNYPWKTL